MDVQRALTKIRNTLTKITDADIEYYLTGKRSEFISILQTKYSFSTEHAEMFLRCNRPPVTGSPPVLLTGIADAPA